MKILYISHYFPPEMGAPAARVSELSRHWAQSGHQVTVLTGFPNNPTGIVPLEYRAKMRRLVYREQVDGIDVVRTWLLARPNRRAYERMLNYGSFCLSSCVTGVFLDRPEVIIATSPQPLVGLSGWWLSRIKRVPFILEVRDLWPESIPAVGAAGQTAALTRVLGALAQFLYRSCDHVVVVSPAFKEELVVKWRVRPEKISVVENGVETNLFTPNGTGDDGKKALGLHGKFVVSYIGMLGMAHGLSTALEAAAQLVHTLPDVFFLFVGDGADKEHLISLARAKGLTNVCFQPAQPREKIPALIRISDLCLVLLKRNDVFKTVIPSKMLEFMACGRPVVLGVDGQARRILEEAKAGVFISPEDPRGLAQAITHLYHDPELRQTLGRNGRCYMVARLSRQQTAKVYASTLERVTLHWRRDRNFRDQPVFRL